MAELTHYLVLSGVLFTIGTLGVFLRRNVITILLSIEVMLNAVNLSAGRFSRAYQYHYQYAYRRDSGDT